MYFRYKYHPGDLMRSAEITRLPDPKNEMEDFLVQFLPCYQNDERVTYISDLSRFLDDDFSDEIEKQRFIDYIGGEKSEKEINQEINSTEEDLISSAYQNFYSLVLTNKLEFFHNDDK